jgi:integrase
MNELQLLLDEYLAARRALGAKLKLPGRLLQRFVAFVAQRKANFITTELALQWATEPRGAQPAQWANRLAMVRRFAQYASTVEPRHEVPPPDLLPYRYHRPPPYIYRDEEVAALIGAAQRLHGFTGLRPHTCATLLGLVAVTGMRVNEPLGLDRDDVDLAHGVLTVRGSKFGKSRLVPVHDSTRQALRHYAAQRDHLCTNPHSPSFFLSERGTRVTEWALRWTFVKLSRQCSLRGPTDSHGPRLHDFRHRFAVNTLLRWYRGGVDIEHHLPHLATYLGHAHVSDTYWYLTATPELLQLAARRLDRVTRRGLS